MGGDGPGRYVALSQASSARPRWWQRFPPPVETLALRVWQTLPHVVRAPLSPLGRLFGPHSVSLPTSPGPDSVPGVADLIEQGFEPVEDHTGAVWVAALWPQEHRRSVVETRPGWLDDPDSDRRVWLIRSPWESLTIEEVFTVLWRSVERDRALDDRLRRARVSEVLGWNETQAVTQLRALGDGE